MFLVALITIGMMLLYAVPGFLMVKSKLCVDDHISAFSKLLLFVCQPGLIIYSMRQVPFSYDLAWNMLLVFLVVLVTGVGFMSLGLLLLKKKMKEDARFRIYNIASCMGNYGFMGVPILQALLPNNPEAMAYSAVACVALNIMAWSAGSAIISQDIRYVSPKKIFLNPTVISFLVAIPLFVFNVSFPTQLEDAIFIFAKMSTPLSMIIMGMRLALTPFKEVFGDWKQYLVIAVKQLAYPLLILLLLLPFSIDPTVKTSIFILMSCPVASVVLNFSELLHEGEKTAASLVLLGTSLSALTIPLLCLFIS